MLGDHSTLTAELLGTVLEDDYRLDTLITDVPTSSHAWVFRATQLSTGETRAVRMLLPDESAVSRYRRRFEREAIVAFRLNHRNIVHVFAIGAHQGTPYFIMEYVPTNLRFLLNRQGALTEIQAVRIINQLCPALEYAYCHGVNFHRDLKPESILLTDDHVVKLAEFGITSTNAAAINHEGVLVGNRYYMSPEQCRGKALDIRSDLYSLGCIFFEMLTGAPPFALAGDTSVQGLLNWGPREKLRTMPELSPILEQVVMKLLADDPDKRYTTPAQVHDALIEYEVSRLPVIDPPAPPSRPAWADIILPEPIVTAVEEEVELPAKIEEFYLPPEPVEMPPPDVQVPETPEPLPVVTEWPPEKPERTVPVVVPDLNFLGSMLVVRPAPAAEPEQDTPAPVPHTEPEPVAPKPFSELKILQPIPEFVPRPKAPESVPAADQEIPEPVTALEPAFDKPELPPAKLAELAAPEEEPLPPEPVMEAYLFSTQPVIGEEPELVEEPEIEEPFAAEALPSIPMQEAPETPEPLPAEIPPQATTRRRTSYSTIRSYDVHWTDDDTELEDEGRPGWHFPESRSRRLWTSAIATLVVTLIFLGMLYLLAPQMLGDLANQAGARHIAISSFERAARQNPDDAEIHLALARCFRKDAPARMLAEYQAALKIKSDIPEALTTLGDAMVATGNLEAAESYYKQVRDLQPDNHRAEECLAWILRMREAMLLPYAADRFELSQNRKTPFKNPLPAGNSLYYRVLIRNRLPELRTSCPWNGNAARFPWFRNLQASLADDVQVIVIKRMSPGNRQKAEQTTASFHGSEATSTSWEKFISIGHWGDTPQLTIDVQIGLDGKLAWEETVVLRGK